MDTEGRVTLLHNTTSHDNGLLNFTIPAKVAFLEIVSK